MAVEQCITMRKHNEYLHRQGISLSPAEVAAWTSSLTKWKSLPVKVYFTNECPWNYNGDKLISDTILQMVNHAWNLPNQDCFKRVYGSSPNDIRVSFQEGAEGCWSMIGSVAESNTKEPSMVLNFAGMSDAQIKATILHQFGHALGLGHALMPVGDWDLLRQFVNVEEMRSSYGVRTLQEFEQQWAGKGTAAAHYDRDSVMQCFTKASWITNAEYQSKEKLKFSGMKLENPAREVLERFHDLTKCTKDASSTTDKQDLVRFYTELNPQPVAVAPSAAAAPFTTPQQPVQQAGAPKMYLGKKAPDIRDLSFVKNPKDKSSFKLFPKIGPQWQELCMRLGLDDYISEWGRLYTDNERLQKIFGKWKDNARNLEGDAETYSYSWEGLKNLLDDAECGNVADDFFEFLEKVPPKK